MRTRLALLIATLWPTLLAAAVPSHFSVTVDLQPGPAPHQYVCRAKVLDIDSGEVIAAPSLDIAGKEPGNMTIDGPVVKTDLSVNVGADGRSASVNVTVSRGSKPIAVQRSTFKLP